MSEPARPAVTEPPDPAVVPDPDSAEEPGAHASSGSSARFVLALGIAVAVVVVDQLTKRWAVDALADGPIVLIDGWLELDLTFNPGAAFSSLQGIGPLLGIAAVAVAGWITILIRRRSTGTGEVVALALVLGGAVGNLVDRVTRGDGLLDGAVVDFIEPSFFPTFNVADAAITVGAVLLVVFTLTHAGGDDATGDAGS
jgi:signal peptidase II